MTIDLNNIGQNGLKSIERARSESKSNNPGVGNSEHSPATKQDSASGISRQDVKLSSDAQTLSRLSESLDTQESFDVERVTQIKQALENGDYPIDNQRLAAKFLELEHQLNQ